MCDPVTIAYGVAIGAATGAAGAAVTGQDVGRGALMGGIMGGVTGGMGGLSPTGTLANVGQAVGATTGKLMITQSGSMMAQHAMVGMAVTGFAGSVAMGTLFPEPEPYDFEGYDPSAYGYSPIRYNAQHNTITGSGGRQAASVLASEIQRNRRIQRETPSDVSALSTGGVPMTGLQLA